MRLPEAALLLPPAFVAQLIYLMRIWHECIIAVALKFALIYKNALIFLKRSF